MPAVGARGLALLCAALTASCALVLGLEDDVSLYRPPAPVGTAEAGAADAGQDAAADSAPGDARPDSASDATTDAPTDATTDAPTDAPACLPDGACACSWGFRQDIVRDGGDGGGWCACDGTLTQVTVDGGASGETMREVCAHDFPVWGRTAPTSLVLHPTTGTASDPTTQLMWEDPPADGPYGRDEAEARCQGLALAGYDDWRVPTAAETLTIVSFDRTPSSGLLVAPALATWTSIPVMASAPATSWVMYWTNVTQIQPPGPTDLANGLGVRCVRNMGGVPAVSERFVDKGGGVVMDSATGLLWARSQAVGKTWTDAGAYCAGLMTPASSWRLPTVDELLSIVDRGRVFPATDPIFLGTQNYTWTSTPNPPFADFYRVVNFDRGNSLPMSSSTSAAVRCVHD